MLQVQLGSVQMIDDGPFNKVGNLFPYLRLAHTLHNAGNLVNGHHDHELVNEQAQIKQDRLRIETTDRLYEWKIKCVLIVVNKQTEIRANRLGV